MGVVGKATSQLYIVDQMPTAYVLLVVEILSVAPPELATTTQVCVSSVCP